MIFRHTLSSCFRHITKYIGLSQYFGLLAVFISSSIGQTIFEDVQVNDSLIVDGPTTLAELYAGDLVIDSLESAGNARLGYGTAAGSLSFGTISSIEPWSLGTSGGLDFVSSSSEAEFTWWDAYDKTMILTGNNHLILKNKAYDDNLAEGPGNYEYGIVLDPSGTTTFGYDVSFLGSDNLMPEQTITGSSSILTVELADELYAPTSAIQAVDNDNFGGIDSYTIGQNNYSTGSGYDQRLAIGDHNGVSTGSSVFGRYNYTLGNTNMAVGLHNSTDGYAAMAFGWANCALAGGAISLGNGTWASGENSVVIGRSSVTRGNYSFAFGENVESSTRSGTAFGTLNIDLPGSVTAWQPQDPLLMVGNGQFTDASGNVVSNPVYHQDNSYPYPINNYIPYSIRSNALVIRKSGAMEVIAHSTLGSSDPVFSVMDGTVDPANPESIMSVSKVGEITAQAYFGEALLVSELQAADGVISNLESWNVWALGLSASNQISVGAGNSDQHSFMSDYSIIGDYAMPEPPIQDVSLPVIGIGAGTSVTQRANAMVVRKNGDTDVSGVLRVPPAGDLSMGAFRSGRDPREALDPNEILPSKDFDPLPES